MSPYYSASECSGSSFGDNMEPTLDNPVMIFTMTGDLDGLEKVFGSSAANAIKWTKERNYNGKTALDMACILGRVRSLGIFFKNGVDMHGASDAGYTLAHTAAAWGQVETLRFLDSCEVNWLAKNKHGETPEMIAIRYEKEESEIFIKKALAKIALIACVARVREGIETADKTPGLKLTKEDKASVTSACNEKLEWATTCLKVPEDEGDKEVTQSDIEEKQKSLEDYLQIVLIKAAQPVTKPGGGSRKNSKKGKK